MDSSTRRDGGGRGRPDQGRGRGRGGNSGSGSGRRGDSQHVDPFSDETDTEISQHSSRAGLGSAARQPHSHSQSQPHQQQQQPSSGKFNRHTQNLSGGGGRVPKFLADIVAASSQAVRRQLPTSIVDGLARGDEEEEARAEAGDTEAKQRRDSRIAREMEQRAKEEEGSDRPIRDDEMPAVVNLSEYAHHTAQLTQLLGRAPTQQLDAQTAEAEERKDEGEVQRGGGGGGGGKRQRAEDERADELERTTGQHVFRKGKSRVATTNTEQSPQSASKKPKTAAASSKAASKLSFDEEDV